MQIDITDYMHAITTQSEFRGAAGADQAAADDAHTVAWPPVAVSARSMIRSGGRGFASSGA